MPHKQIFTAKNGQTKNLDKAIQGAKDFVLNNLHDRWQAYTIEVKKKRKASRYKEYFGYVIDPILKSGILQAALVNDDELWTLTPELVHGYLKLTYAAVNVTDTTTGETVTLARSTTELDDYEFIGLYMEKIRADFSLRGVVFPQKPEREELAPWNDPSFIAMINQ